MQLTQELKKKVQRITITMNGKDTVFKTGDSTGNNRLSSDDLRVQTILQYGAGNITPTATISIYGLTIDTMNPLLRVNWNTMGAILNTIRVEAGEQGDKTLSLAYEGNITFARIDTSNAPTMCLQIESQMAMVESLTIRDPKTYDQGQDAAEIIKQIASDMGYQFENNGATHIIAEAVTLNGSLLSRIQKLCADCDFDLYAEQRSISICARGVSRNIKIPIITRDTGLKGYPSPDIRGISFRCLYSPLVRFGGIVRIADSLIGVCNGDWRVYGLVATLESNVGQGRWEMEVSATPKDAKDVAISK